MTMPLERLPYVWTLPKALGTGMLIHTGQPISGNVRDRVLAFTESYESVLSRFRPDSMVSRMGDAPQGGTFVFPSWTEPLFNLLDHLTQMTDGALDPCVGEDLIRLGYGADMTFTMPPDASGRLGAIHGRPTWRGDIERNGTTLVTRRPVHLDFGACGKGYLVDLLAGMLVGADMTEELVIDAGGDMTITTNTPIRIALEDPLDTSQAIGVATTSHASVCASAPSRRHWGRMHHLLSALDGRPVTTVAATWVTVAHHTGPRSTTTRSNTTPDASASLETLAAAFPTAVADGLSTSLFVTSELIGRQRTAHRLPMTYAILYADRHAAVTDDFPGTLFTSSPRP